MIILIMCAKFIKLCIVTSKPQQFILNYGFTNSHADTSLFVFNTSDIMVYLLVYIDDIIITGDNDGVVQKLILTFTRWLFLKDLRPLSYFLGIEVTYHHHGLFPSQHQHIGDFLAHTRMSDAKLVTTPFATSPTLELHTNIVSFDPIEYQTIINSLQYPFLTRLDIAFALNKLSQFMHRLTIDHQTTINRLFQYLCGTSNHGLVLYFNSQPLFFHTFFLC